MLKMPYHSWRKVQMRDAFVETLLEEARVNKNIFLITGDLGFGVLDKFQKELPDQFINSGVNEQTMMGMAAGIASTGKRVFVYSIGNFATLRCLEQIRNDVCLMDNSVVVVSVGAGYAYGPQGYTHHALEDIAVIRALPNIEVVVPADPLETSQITKLLAQGKFPSYLRLGKSNEQVFSREDLNTQHGKINEIVSGANGTILFVGSIGKIALEASNLLLNQGISVSVASVPFISRQDAEYLIKSASKGPIVTVEEHAIRGGFGSSILEFLNKENIPALVGIVSAEQNNLSQIGSQEFLRISNGIDAARIVSKFLALVGVLNQK
jgi:transketolase